jgi:integral membrane protein
MPHGLLFVAYIFLAIVIRQLKKWDAKTTIIVLLASIVPFGTFYVDKKYL